MPKQPLLRRALWIAGLVLSALAASILPTAPVSNADPRATTLIYLPLLVRQTPPSPRLVVFEAFLNPG